MGADGKVEITKDEYNNLLVSRLGGFQLLNHTNLRWQNSIHIAVLSSGFDMSLPLKEQETVEVAKVIAYVRRTSCDHEIVVILVTHPPFPGSRGISFHRKVPQRLAGPHAHPSIHEQSSLPTEEFEHR